MGPIHAPVFCQKITQANHMLLCACICLSCCPANSPSTASPRTSHREIDDADLIVDHRPFAHSAKGIGLRRSIQAYAQNSFFRQEIGDIRVSIDSQRDDQIKKKILMVNAIVAVGVVGIGVYAIEPLLDYPGPRIERRAVAAIANDQIRVEQQPRNLS